MIDSDVDAILVKVASIGLHPLRHLGKTIAELQPQFMMLVRRGRGFEGWKRDVPFARFAHCSLYWA
jgi:hypothetical protein